MQKSAETLRRVFYICFAVCFAWLFGNVVFNNMHFSYAIVPTIVSTVVWLGLFFLLAWASNRYAAFLCAHEKICLAAFFILLFITQVFFYMQLASYPTRDLEPVFRGAYTYAIAGKMDEIQIDYFYKHPNNLPFTVLLTFLFRVARKFGMDAYESYIALASAFNGVCLAAGYWFTYLCARRLKNVHTGFTALGILYLCLPLQFLISVCYTDTTTLLFAPFALYLYLCARVQPHLMRKLLLYAAMGAVMGLGTQIKYSVAFTVIALAIDALLSGKWKHALAATGGLVLGFLLWGAVFNSFVYAHVLDKTLARDAATPFSSYLMMSMHGDGAFNAADRQFAWSFATKEEKETAIRAQIQQQMQSYTPASFAVFLNQKAVRSFGSANMEYDFTAANSPMQQGFFVECISKGGRWYEACGIVTQGWHIAVYLLCIACAIHAFRRKNHAAFVPLVSLFGLLLFLLIWEASQRYLVNYTAMAVLCGALLLAKYTKEHT